MIFRRQLRAWVCSRALFGVLVFRKRVRACARSRAGVFVFRRHLRACVCSRALTGFREHVRVRARSRAGATLVALLALPRRGELCGEVAEFLHSHLLPSSPGRSQDRDPVISLKLHEIPGSSPGMTGEVEHPSERPRGGLARACEAASRKRGSRELKETSRKHGPLNLAPLFVFYRRSTERPVRW